MNKFFFLLISVFSFSVVAQVNDQQIAVNEIGANALQAVRNAESSVVLLLDEDAVCFPDYKRAFVRLKKKIQQSSQEFENNLESRLDAFQLAIGEEFSDYNAVLKLAASDSLNVGYQKLLEDKKTRFEAAMGIEEAAFREDYRLITAKLQHALDIRLVFGMDYKNVDWRGIYGTYFTTYPVESFGYGELKEEFTTYSRKFGDYMKITPSNEMSYIINSKIKGFNKSTVFNDCKTAGCVYLLNEQVKKWVHKLKEMNLNLNLKTAIGHHSFPSNPISAKSEKISPVLDMFAKRVSAKLPIGNVEPKCTVDGN